MNQNMNNAVHRLAMLTTRSKGNPYNVADARHVDFPKFGGRGAPKVVDIGSVSGRA